MQDYLFNLKNHILKDYSTHVLYALPYGSKIYGTKDNLSDIDLIVVVDEKSFRAKDEYVIKGVKFDCDIVGTDSFAKSISEGSVKFIEATMHSEKWESIKHFVALSQIQKSFIQKAQKSWNKALNNLQADNWHAVLLNAYHAIRILIFLIQIKEKCIIYNYEEAKEVKDKVFQIETIEEFNFFIKAWFEELLLVVSKQSINDLS